MRETKIGLNVKDIQHRLFKAVHVSVESSYKFLQSHPKISCVLFIFFILYAFLSYIYTFLNYISPFLICAAIFLRIFWSSEQTQLRYVKRDEEKKVEQQQQKRVEFEFDGEVEDETKFPKILHNIGKRELLYKYPSQNATSRRRNFREKKWDVYGGLEEKAKNLSAVFQNEFTKKSTFEKGESSLYYGLSGKRTNVLNRQTTLRSEPSMIDLVEIDEGDETEKLEEYVESEEEDEEDPREEEEERNKAIEWTEDDQKNLMDLGQSEMERNKRLESLIARRRERKLLKLQLENGLIDKKSMTPNLMAPLVIKKGNPNIDGDLEMPSSAPSFMPRSPYDFPYEPFEEKPNLTEDGFLQEYHKEMPFCRHESFISLGNISSSEASDRLAYSRFRKLPDKGNHDWLIDQLMYNEGAGIGIPQSNPLTKGEESTHEDDQKCKTDIDDMKVEKDQETSHETKSISNETNEPNSIPNFTNVARFSKLNLPLPTRNTTTTPTSNTMKEFMYDNIPSPLDKRQETMFLNDRRLCHTPTYSIASDLQVEVSEIGSPTSTVDDDDNNVDNNSSTDRDSVLYDGDIDRDVSSGSEDLWGASFHGVRSEEDIIKDVVSPISLRQIDEENVADISSYSSRSDLHDDTPTSAINVDDVNPFGYMNYSVGETEAPQYSNSSSMDQLPNETHSERQQDWCNISENLTNESEVINDVNNNTTTTEQDNIENSISNEDPGPSTSVTRQESIDETSNYSVTSSPRSVLPDKTTTDNVSSSAAFNQEMDTDAEQSTNIGETAQETFNGETSPPETMQQNIQPLMDDINNESHNVDFNHSQEQTNPIENSIEESNIFGNMDAGEICREEEPDKLNNEENSEDNSTTNQTNQEGTSESTIQLNDMTTTKDVDDKVPLVEDDKNEIPANP